MEQKMEQEECAQKADRHRLSVTPQDRHERGSAPHPAEATRLRLTGHASLASRGAAGAEA
eukprot:CAMPEP_0180394842 /NCGR_PEP_ID=MMETSP0989-20121125/34508_1 /TAXON_ID=697907 /ORGANISM="non described non described, Strain CCMP2293" /LENGTH=59 /DNA_ID=CAMNT_0022396839 /DNA_START=176 /DNA_END=351 /DNA_ORIENTATION=+